MLLTGKLWVQTPQVFVGFIATARRQIRALTSPCADSCIFEDNDAAVWEIPLGSRLKERDRGREIDGSFDKK